jgi:hypothetical protein
VTFDLGRRLLLSSAITAGELRHAVYETVVGNKPFPRALADASATARSIIDRGLDEPEGAISAVMPTVEPLQELVDALPRGLLRWLVAVPVRRDPRSGAIDLAVVDPLDPYAASEVAFHLRLPVRARAASLASIERALAALVESDPIAPPSTQRKVIPTRPPPATDPIMLISPSASRGSSDREEDAMPLVRRARPSLAPPTNRKPASVPPGPLSLAPVTPRSISPSQAGSVAMVLDFSASSREARESGDRSGTPSTQRGAPPAPSMRPPALKRAPYVPLDAALDTIERADTRDVLVAGLLRGLLTTAQSCALLVPRKGRYVGLAAGGELDIAALRDRAVPIAGALADALANRVRIGHLDGVADAELLDALGLRQLAAVDVLLQPVFVSEKPAMVLISFGIGEIAEAAARARALAIAASTALVRMLRGRG